MESKPYRFSFSGYRIDIDRYKMEISVLAHPYMTGETQKLLISKTPSLHILMFILSFFEQVVHVRFEHAEFHRKRL
jgi:hypothetical protein